MLIDRYMPEFDVSEHHLVRVKAPADRTYEAARRVDLARSPVIRSLFAVRGLPAIVRRKPVRTGRRFTLEDFVRAGFVWLADESPTEIVLGAAGKFWRPSGGLIRLLPDDFESYHQDGCAKAAMNVRVVPVDEVTSIVTTETRVLLPHDESRRAFLLYWAAIGPFSALVRKQALALIKRSAEVAERSGG